jgi:hypothetical protein
LLKPRADVLPFLRGPLPEPAAPPPVFKEPGRFLTNINSRFFFRFHAASRQLSLIPQEARAAAVFLNGVKPACDPVRAVTAISGNRLLAKLFKADFARTLGRATGAG